ncbi:MAG: hypothetical protein RLZZ324_316 [Candidatus Parcubacteria bacterium]
MNPLLSFKTVRSKKNGTIFVRRVAGVSTVVVGAYAQSGTYMTRLWRNALRRVPRGARISSVLVLGLGAGSCLKHVRRRFRDAKVTVIEWDPAMVAIAREVGALRFATTPEIIVGDAVDIVPGLNRRFDLILVDIYTGGELEPRLASAEMVNGLAKALAPDGCLLLNLFTSSALIPAYQSVLRLQEAWQFEYNAVAAFRPMATDVV